MGPLYAMKPGEVQFLSMDAVTGTRDLNLDSAFEWQANPETTRLDSTTNEQLGMNMYAEDRPTLKRLNKPASSNHPAPQKPAPKNVPAEETKDMTQEYDSLSAQIRPDKGDDKDDFHYPVSSIAKTYFRKISF